MAVTHPAAVRSIIADAVVDSIDVGGAGSLILQTAGAAEVATLTFSATAFGAASGGVATANAITSDTDATGNASPIAQFVIENGSSAAAGFNGSVGTSGEDLNLSSLVIGAGDTVSVSALTYTAAV